MSWQAIASDKEKYQAYLCSREWCARREAVRKRSDGKCERCRVNEMDHVHHLTYARKYDEPLDDLQALCKQCHEFTHGKSNHDPRAYAPVFIKKGKPIRSVYLAGKITGDGWRGEIVEGWSIQRGSPFTWDAVVDSEGKEWVVAEAAIDAACGAKLDYVGPWWSDLGELCGHVCASGCTEPHAYGYEWRDFHGTKEPVDAKKREQSARLVTKNVQAAVCNCDLLFAWINSDDCFGTIFEIGMAVSMKKTVVIATPPSFDCEQMWLPRRFAAVTLLADTAGDAWRQLWAQVEKGVKYGF
jgi:hypothetical protein